MWNELTHSSVQWPSVWAWIGSILTVQFFNYVPIFNQYCGTAPVPGRYWGIAIGWAALLFAVCEVRKWIVILYPQSWIAKHDF